MKTTSRILLFATLLLLCAAASIQAEEGRIPIFEPVELSGADANGQFVVTRDIAGSAGLRTIAFLGTGVEEVDLDLNGFTLSSPPGTDLVVFASELRRFTIRNGSLRATAGVANGTLGVLATGTDHRAIVTNVNVVGGYGVALVGVTSFVVRDNVVTEANNGILISTSNVARATGVAEGNVIRDATISGLAVTAGAGGLRSARVVNNQIDQDGSGINLMAAEGLVFEGNTFVGGGGVLLSLCPGARVVGNVIQDAVFDPAFGFGGGLRLASSPSALVQGNTITNGDEGLVVLTSKNCLILENVTTSSAAHGIHLLSAAQGHLEGNLANDNAGFGIFVDGGSSGVRIGGNSATGNL
ncbi:MAG: hypothetical protein GY725_15525, partial [bacterium]|nr:hypothetical protein [bacterium]